MSELVRIVYEYSDGTKKFISNEELEKWMKFNSIVASCAQNHNVNPPWDDIKWKKEGKERPY
jgi:hypothetical protein